MTAQELMKLTKTELIAMAKDKGIELNNTNRAKDYFVQLLATEEVVKVEENVSTEEPILVTVDTSVVDILNYNKEGKQLHFADSPKLFKDLDEGTVRSLSRKNRIDYSLANATKKQAERNSMLGITDGLEILGPRAARRNPKSKLAMIKDIAGKNMHPCWKRPEQITESLEIGYKPILKPNSEKDATSEQFYILKRKNGKDDLIAMECPMDDYHKEIAYNAIESKRRIRGSKEKIKEIAEDLKTKLTDDSYEETIVMSRRKKE